MKRFFFALLLLCILPGSIQASTATVSDSTELFKLTEQQYNQLKRLVYLEAAHNDFKASLSELSAQSEGLSLKVNETLERLAQSESAMNATLETFQQQFEDQNKTIAEVQEVLDTKMNQMLMYIGLGILIALVAMVVVARSAAANAVKSHQANWNSFQEHIFKSK